MRLIDADALLDKLPKEYLGSTVHLLINNAPTMPIDEVLRDKELVIKELSKNIDIILAEKPRGEWVHDTHYGVNLPEHKCSICGEWECSAEESNFCPNCGAKMGGDTE